ncbi:hypothetical protein ACP4OV_003283 [Aristida adscensionis]
MEEVRPGGGGGARRQEEGEMSAPLLEKKATGAAVYFEGCPGCAVDRRKAARPGIPYGNFLFVWVVTLCTAAC